MIEIKNVSKAFFTKQTPIHVLEGVSLSITEGEFVALVGPSGCGKSTLLNLIAGLIAADMGEVKYDGSVVSTVNTDVGYMTQKDSLLPWRNVEANIGTPLEIRHVPRQVQAGKVKEAVDKVGLTGFESHYPHELSGGMRKRVLLARTLIYEPRTLLMDEPFGALDALIKLILQQELLRIWEEARKTVVYVTHDLDEAISLADRIVVFSRRPARVVLDLPVNIPRPRNVAEIRLSASFAELHERLWQALREEVISEGMVLHGSR